MDDKKIIMISAIVIVIIAIIAAFTLFGNDSYKDVDESYVQNPSANENVRFTATYFGKTSAGSQADLSSDIDVVRVGYGNTFAFIKGKHSEFNGKEGDDFTLEGHFNVNDSGKQSGAVNGLLATGYEFVPDRIG